MSDVDDESKSKEDESKPKIKNQTDIHRLKLEKLMKNPNKPVYIPEMRKNKKFPDAVEFVRNVMGSSAGAGSGEFHVYRHIRRREYSRMQYMQAKNDKQLLDEEYDRIVEKRNQEAANKTAKKRNKRQRYKMKKRLNKLQNKNKQAESSTDSESSSSNSDGEDENETTMENDRIEKVDNSKPNEQVTCDKRETDQIIDKDSLIEACENND